MSLDIRDNLEKGKRTTEQTVYVHKNYVGFASRQEMSVGISFVGIVKGEPRREKHGGIRWYHSGKNTLSDALPRARKRYAVKLPVNGWIKLRLKVYNSTGADEIIKVLTQNLSYEQIKD